MVEKEDPLEPFLAHESETVKSKPKRKPKIDKFDFGRAEDRGLIPYTIAVLVIGFVLGAWIL